MSGTPDANQPKPTPPAAIPLGTLLRRLAALAWRHRWVALPSALLTIFMQGVTLAMFGGQGLAIDLVRKQVDPGAPDPHWPAWMTPPAGVVVHADPDGGGGRRPHPFAAQRLGPLRPPRCR